MIQCSRMRTAYAMIGLGFLIIFGGLYLANVRFTKPSDVPLDTSNNSLNTMSSTLTLTSSAFDAQASIPSQFTCDGKGINPPLTFGGVPESTKSLVLIMDDPDVPKALKQDGIFDHWVLFNIPPTTKEIASGEMVGTLGGNGAGKNQYAAPCPPKQYEPSEHRYFFKLYALDTELSLSTGASKSDVEKAMQGRIIAEAQLVGKYKRQ
ncbi:MAG: YbhB and YbcL [Candidatus Kaiserbacteria bacterium GW2011_GWC2_52_8b]|uniref:YbhB and YbcL n=2 Tax=Candidatus Kaiseribacteriota TaxID=1752734 RepID=A0A0G2AG78_9BACT|nr:MAG: YbhB and YbcL [Candidatus Kaiserbacteria bacterium GW2011_GWA2_52_12]KKW31539.1 MAG: YbhB and YbcL [Candidatus Kaiserbacteria bacterium GW2011_GWC2_52_8b]